MNLHHKDSFVVSIVTILLMSTSGYFIDNVGWLLYASGTRTIRASSGVRPLLINNCIQETEMEINQYKCKF